MNINQQIQSFEQNKKRLFKYQVFIFILTFLAYSSLHCTRTTWSFVTTYFINNHPEWKTDNSSPQVGWINTAFLFSYSIGMQLGGGIGDRIPLQYFVAFGMIPASICLFFYAMLGYWNVQQYWPYLILMAFNGLFQSTGFPGLVASMGNWFGKGKRGLLIGLWAGCQNFGDILGLQIVGPLFYDINQKWYNPVQFAALFAFFMGLCILFFLKPYPRKLGIRRNFDPSGPLLLMKDSMKSSQISEKQYQAEKLIVQLQEGNTQQNSQSQGEGVQDQAGLTSPFIKYEEQQQQPQIASPKMLANMKHSVGSEYSQTDDEQQSDKQNKDTNQNNSIQQQKNIRINYFTAWCVPGVALYAATFALVKGSTYGLLFWLPNYLNNELVQSQQSQSGNISAMNDYGAFLGGFITGYLSDMKGLRAIYMCPMLLICSFLMLVVRLFLSNQALPYYFVIFGIGVFLGGPYNIICSAISIDLSKQKALRGNKTAQSTITSLIDGFGSFIAAIMQVVIPYLQQAINTQFIFYIFMFCCFIAFIFLIPFARKDLIEWKQKNKQEIALVIE